MSRVSHNRTHRSPKAQCFFLLAKKIAGLVIQQSGGLAPESLQGLYNIYIFIKVIAIGGYFPLSCVYRSDYLDQRKINRRTLTKAGPRNLRNTVFPHRHNLALGRWPSISYSFCLYIYCLYLFGEDLGWFSPYQIYTFGGASDRVDRRDSRVGAYAVRLSSGPDE